jgi:hypothetical protein
VSWTQHDAISMCEVLESVVPEIGAHVALTGGCLYKAGRTGGVQRKDCDVLFYRIRQRKCIDMDAMWKELAKFNFVKISGFGWCYKAQYLGKPVDCFFPEGERDENGNEIEYGVAEANTSCETIEELPF